MNELINLDPQQLNEVIALALEAGLNILAALIIMIAGWVIGNWVKKRITNVKKLDATLTFFLGGLFKYAVLAVALVTVLSQFGVETASLITVLGAAGLAIGLALQGTLSNVAAGAMLLVLRPFAVNDYIKAGNIEGTVKSLGLFGSELSTPDNVFIFVPNSKIWNSDIYNYSRNQQRRHDFILGISYGDDINKAFKAVEKIIKKEDRIITGTEGKEPQIMVDSLGDSSVNIRVRLWCKASDYWPIKWDLNKDFKEILDSDNITIPFPTRTLEVINKDVASTPAKKKK